MKNAFKMIGLPLVILMTVVVGLAGCGQIADTAQDIKGAVDNIGGDADGQPAADSPADVKGVTLQEYFGGVMPNVYRKIDGSTVFCRTGDCPEEINLSNYLVNEDVFAEIPVEVLEDRIIAYSGSPQYVDTLANCTEKSSFAYPSEYIFIEKTDQRIVATGTGSGHKEQIGTGCGDGEYNYSYQTQETWIFTTEQLERNATVKATMDIPGYIIDVSGWRNPQSNPQYSEHAVIVRFQSPDGFRVRPFVKVVRVNGVEATASLSSRAEEIDESTFRYTFGAFYDAEYAVVGGLWVYGKNGAVLAEIYSDDRIVVKVTGSQQGALPESFYK